MQVSSVTKLNSTSLWVKVNLFTILRCRISFLNKEFLRLNPCGEDLKRATIKGSLFLYVYPSY